MTIDVTSLAQGCPTATGFESALLDALARHVGFDAASFLLAGASAPTTRNVDADALADALRSGVHEAELWPVKAAALGARGVAVDTDVLGQAAVARTRYFRRFAAPIGGRHSLMGYLSLRGRVIGALMLGRCRGGFRDREIRAVEALLPAVAVARASFGGVAPMRIALPQSPRGLGALPLVRDLPRVRARVTGREVDVLVRDRRGEREMLAASGDDEMVWTRASLSDAAESGWPYVALFHVAAALARSRERALFVGCGGGVAVHQFARVYPGIALDVVESEAAVVELARDWFALDAVPGLSVFVDDGVSFVEAAEARRWDVVIVDAYGASELADGVRTCAFFQALRRALRPGGAMAFNVVGTLDEEGGVRAIVDAASRALDDVRVVPVMVPNEDYAPSARRNVVVVGRKLDRAGRGV